ncbi:hypothetical protein PCL51_13125 [Staphylococcus aureus]|nr:hypothetical protein PCL51_13125 [Staphylococcus aureus]
MRFRKGLYRKRMLSYGGLLKEKHKILYIDYAKDEIIVEEEIYVQLRQFEICRSNNIIS